MEVAVLSCRTRQPIRQQMPGNNIDPSPENRDPVPTSEREKERMRERERERRKKEKRRNPDKMDCNTETE